MTLNFKPLFNKVLHLGFIVIGGLLLNTIQAQTQRKPNLLFIITDQQRFDALSLAGNAILKTPNLDRLANQGAWFKNAYTQCAVCGPARASILTGCTVENHQIITNEVSNSKKETGRMSMPTFDELLSKNGYRCEYYGKWHSPEFHTDVFQNPEMKANELHNDILSCSKEHRSSHHEGVEARNLMGADSPTGSIDTISNRVRIFGAQKINDK